MHGKKWLNLFCVATIKTNNFEMSLRKRQKLEPSKFTELPDEVIFHIYEYACNYYLYLPIRFSRSVCRLNRQVFLNCPLMAAAAKMFEEYGDLCEEEMHIIRGEGKRRLKPKRVVYDMFPARRPRGFYFPF